MLTGVFKDRSSKERLAREEHALAQLLTARELRGFTLTRHCEIGPFVVEYLFAEQSLIVELASSALPPDQAADGSRTSRQDAARRKFLTDMGYAVLTLNPRELIRQPQQALARVRAALRS